MSNLSKIIYLTQSQYATLSANGTVGAETGIDNNALYVTSDPFNIEDITGILPVNKGGTGVSTLSSGELLVGNGTNAISTIAKSSNNIANAVVERDASGNFSAGTIAAKYVNIEHIAGAQDEFHITYGNTVDMSFMIGTGNENHGIYDHIANKWMIYANSTGKVIVNGNAATATAANITTTTNAIARYSDGNGTFADSKVKIDNNGAIEVNNTSTFTANTYTKVMNYLAANMVANSNIAFTFGKAASTKNRGYIAFHYTDDGSDSNYIEIGLLSVNNILNITGEGKIGIGTTIPTEKLEVDGNVKATAFKGIADVALKLTTSTLGSTTKPIYLNAGVATECDTYAGGTSITLNNVSKTASTASFYAPTSGGTAGYPLIGAGTTAEPTWYGGLTLTGSNASSYIASFTGTTASTSTTSGAVKIAGGLGVADQVTATRLAANGSDTDYNLYVNGKINFYLGSSNTATSQQKFIVSGTSGYKLSISNEGLQAYNNDNTAKALYLQYNGGVTQIGQSASITSTVNIYGATRHKTGHLYLDGANASYSTNNTTQIIFGTGSSQHIAISSNSGAIVINPNSSTTTGQIILRPNGNSAIVIGTLTINDGGQSTYKLKVKGTANITTSALINNITISQNSIQSTATLYLDSSGSSSSSTIFRQGTTEQGRWNTSNNFIIGNPSNPNDLTSYKLYVDGAAYATSYNDLTLTAIANTEFTITGGGKTLTISTDNTVDRAVADAFGNTITTTYAPLASPALTGTPTLAQTDSNALITNNDSSNKLATTEFVMDRFRVNDAMLFKGTIGTQTDNPTVTSLPNTHDAGWTYRVVTANTYPIVDSNGKYCEVGTLIICTVDGTTANPTHWTAVETNEDGSVIGPASSTANAIPIFSSTSGRVLLNSTLTYDTVNNMLNIPSNGNTSLTAGITISRAAGENEDYAARTIKLGIGSDVSNTAAKAGLHDTTNNKWIVYSDKNGNVVLNGTANRATADADGNTITTTYLKLSGGQMAGSLTWKNSTALPAATSLSYFLGIESFSSGGATKYITAENLRTSISAAASNHIHGNITNGGAITSNDANITIATGDYLLVADISDNGKIGRLATAFDLTKANYCLTQAGTWVEFNNYTYTLPVANYNTLGGLKPAYSSSNAVVLTTIAATNTNIPTITAKSTENGRYYAIEADVNGVPYVNVPWTDTLVNYTTATTTKAYLMASINAPEASPIARSAVGDTGVYLSTTPGQLAATSYVVGEHVVLSYNSTDQSLDFTFI